MILSFVATKRQSTNQWQYNRLIGVKIVEIKTDISKQKNSVQAKVTNGKRNKAQVRKVAATRRKLGNNNSQTSLKTEILIEDVFITLLIKNKQRQMKSRTQRR